jgi:hypothetical protein
MKNEGMSVHVVEHAAIAMHAPGRRGVSGK